MSHYTLLEEIEAAQRVFDHLWGHDLFRDRLARERRFGGYACKTNLNGIMLLHFQLGRIEDETKRPKYIAFSLEKNVRLRNYPKHLSSMQSRDPDATPPRYGGGVAGKSSRRSLSGGWEELDELFSVLWAIEMDDLSVSNAHIILANNQTAQLYLMAPHGLMK